MDIVLKIYAYVLLYISGEKGLSFFTTKGSYVLKWMYFTCPCVRRYHYTALSLIHRRRKRVYKSNRSPSCHYTCNTCCLSPIREVISPNPHGFKVSVHSSLNNSFEIETQVISFLWNVNNWDIFSLFPSICYIVDVELCCVQLPADVVRFFVIIQVLLDGYEERLLFFQVLAEDPISSGGGGIRLYLTDEGMWRSVL